METHNSNRWLCQRCQNYDHHYHKHYNQHHHLIHNTDILSRMSKFSSPWLRTFHLSTLVHLDCRDTRAMASFGSSWAVARSGGDFNSTFDFTAKNIQSLPYKCYLCLLCTMILWIKNMATCDSLTKKIISVFQDGTVRLLGVEAGLYLAMNRFFPDFFVAEIIHFQFRGLCLKFPTQCALSPFSLNIFQKRRTLWEPRCQWPFVPFHWRKWRLCSYLSQP